MTIYLAVNGGDLVPSQFLRVAVEAVSITSAQPAEAAVSWSACVSDAPLEVEDGVVIARGEVVIFRGYVESVTSSASASGTRFKAVLKDALGVWKRRSFLRGQWFPTVRYELGWEPEGPMPSPQWDNYSNTPENRLYDGYYWAVQTLGEAIWEVKSREWQTIPAALRELAYYANEASLHYDSPAHGVVEVGALDFGESPLKPERRVISSPVSCADWLVLIMAPQLDGWCRLDFTATSSTLQAGRFRDSSPVELSDADILSREVDPREVDRAKGVIFTPPWRGDAGWISPWAPFPETAEWGMLQNVAVAMGSEGVTTGLAALEQVADSAMLGRPVGQVEVPANGAEGLRVGGRVTLAGVTLNVQRMLWRLDRDRVSLTLGSARQLGVSDLESLRAWMSRVGNGAAV